MYTPITTKKARQIRGAAKLAQYLAEMTLFRLDVIKNIAGDEELENIAGMTSDELDKMVGSRKHPKSEEGKLWDAFIKTGQEIAQDLIHARIDYDPKNEAMRQQMESIERRIKMYRRGLEREKKVNNRRYYELASESFEIALIIAGAEKALKYEDAEKFYELGRAKGSDAKHTRLM